MHIEGLDELDNKILAIIKDNARLSYSEIGEKACVSRVCVKNRMTALEQKGIIKGYQTVIDSEAASGEEIKFFIDAEFVHPYYDNAAAAFAAEKSIREVYAISGTDHIIGVGYTRNQKNLKPIVNKLNREQSIKHITYQIVLSTIKDMDGGVDYAIQKHQGSEHLEKSAEQEPGAGSQPV